MTVSVKKNGLIRLAEAAVFLSCIQKVSTVILIRHTDNPD